MARMEDDDSEIIDNAIGGNLPQVKQSTYSGPTPATNYSSPNGASLTASTPAAGGFGSLGNASPGNDFGSPKPSSFGGSAPVSAAQSTSTAGQAAGAMHSGADVLVANDNTDWINKKWRPVMGWVYMMTCTADFVVFPILWSLLQAMSKGQVTSQWQPLTLQGAGLYHIAMGAVLGIAAYGRTKEKVEGKA